MIQLIKDYLRKQEHKKAVVAFLGEVKANLESYYVMFQINRLRFFTLTAWDKVKDIPWTDAVSEYVQRLTEYNQVLQDYKNYEQWYNADLDHKNQDNGRVLHHKKELTQERFKGLEEIIKNAALAIEDKC